MFEIAISLRVGERRTLHWTTFESGIALLDVQKGCPFGRPEYKGVFLIRRVLQGQ
jgi:hypothetical protein